MSLARGLDYYTGIIYEAVTEKSAPPGEEEEEEWWLFNRKNKHSIHMYFVCCSHDRCQEATTKDQAWFG